MRASAIFTTLLGALALAGCGGGDGSATSSGDAAATVIPSSAVGFVSINTDLGSDQWEQVDELSQKFPGRDEAIAKFLDSLGDEGLDWEGDVEPALGPEVGIAVLVQGQEPRVVALTQPDDEAKLKALAARSDEELVTREVGDWWAIAEKDADIDLFEQAQDDGALADDDTFQTAVADLPDESLVTFFVDGKQAQQLLESEGGNPFGSLGSLVWASGAVEALDEGAKVSGEARIEDAGDLGVSYTPELLERVPSRSLAVLSFKGGGASLEQLTENELAKQFVPQVEQALGVTVAELGDLFRDEGVLYARSGAPIPEISLALRVDDEAEAMATADKLAQRIAPLVEGQTGTASAGDVATRYLEVRGVRISYATFDGMLFLTTGPQGIAEFRGGGEKIGDDDTFKRTKEAAGLGDETSGFLYVNLQDSIGLIQGFAALAGESVPPDLSANLAPLDTLLVHGARDGGEVTFAGYLGIR